jgi:CheY-like chemotaxis protein
MATPTTPHRPASEPARAISVLVVDDEPEITDLLAFAFKAHGCAATQAHGGREAFDVVTSVSTLAGPAEIVQPFA